MQTRTLTAHIPIELAEQVDAAAERLERPRGWIVKQALQNWISLEERRHQMTLDALEAVKEGNLIDHGVIEKWAAGLK